METAGTLLENLQIFTRKNLKTCTKMQNPPTTSRQVNHLSFNQFIRRPKRCFNISTRRSRTNGGAKKFLYFWRPPSDHLFCYVRVFLSFFFYKFLCCQKSNQTEEIFQPFLTPFDS